LLYSRSTSPTGGGRPPISPQSEHSLRLLSLSFGRPWSWGWPRFSGFATEEAFYLTFVDGLDIRGLVLAGTVLGTLGALDDITVTQASTVLELRRANPASSGATTSLRRLTLSFWPMSALRCPCSSCLRSRNYRSALWPTPRWWRSRSFGLWSDRSDL
jgi:hypothetical protein